MALICSEKSVVCAEKDETDESQKKEERKVATKRAIAHHLRFLQRDEQLSKRGHMAMRGRV